MNASNLLNDFFAAGIPAFAVNTEKKSITKSSAGMSSPGKDFRDILNNTIEQDKKVTDKPINNYFNKSNNKVQDSVKKLRLTSGEDKNAKIKDVKDQPDVKGELDEKGGEVIGKAAQMLGIGVEELNNLLSSMNVNLSDLAGDMPVESLVDQISMVAGLDLQQKNLLSEVIQSARQAASTEFATVTSTAADITPGTQEKTEISGMVDLNGKVTAGIANKENRADSASESAGKISENSQSDLLNKKDIVLTSKEVKSPEIEALVMKLKEFAINDEQIKKQNNQQENLKDLKAALTETDANINTGSNEINTAASIMTTPVSVEKSNSKSNQNNILSVGEKKGEETGLPINQSMQENGHGGADASSKETLGWDRKVEVFKEGSQNTEGNKINNEVFQGILTPQMDAESSKTLKADILHKSLAVTKEEVLSQVVEKAKVIIDGGKSEMIMELKPESLGKLSLKIIHERGMVLAKFTAESEQVKQVLETNMQLLKDALQKQGLTVQGFDVSVGQDATARQQAFQSGNRRKSDKLQTVAAESSSLLRAEQITVNAERYNWSQSSINLTA